MAALQELAAEAQRLSENGKYMEAAEAYDKIIDMNDEIAEVYVNKGVALSKADELEGALQAFKRACVLKPEIAGAHLNAGNILKRLERHEEAIEEFQAAIDQDPHLANAWSNLCNELNAIDQSEKAAETAAEGIKVLKSTHIPLHNQRIFALFKLGRPDDALDDVESILEAEPLEKQGADQRALYSMILGQKGSRLLSKGDAENAQSYLERACEGDSTSANLFPYGVCLVQLGKDDEALPVLKQASEKDPENWKIMVTVGTVYLRKKDFPNAIVWFEKAFGTSSDAKQDPTVNFNLAVCYMNTGKDDKAREPLELVVSKDPKNHVALGLLGNLYLQNEEYNDALETLERAAALPEAKDDANIQYNLGYAKLMADKPDEAVENFERSLELNPENEQAAAAVKALKPEQLEKPISKLDIAAQVAENVRAAKAAGRQLDEEAMLKNAERAKTPLERVQAMLTPQRPPYLRRKSMEGIQLGFVSAMAGVYDEMTQENLRPSY